MIGWAADTPHRPFTLAPTQKTETPKKPNSLKGASSSHLWSGYGFGVFCVPHGLDVVVTGYPYYQEGVDFVCASAGRIGAPTTESGHCH